MNPEGEPEQARKQRALQFLEAGECALKTGDPDASRQYLNMALHAARHLSGGKMLADTHVQLGRLELKVGHLDSAQRHLSAALDIYKESGDEEALGRARTHHSLGVLSLLSADNANASRHFGRALRLARRCENLACESWIRAHQGVRFRLMNRPRRAAGHLFLALDLARRSSDTEAEAFALYELGMLSLLMGDAAEAEAHLSGALEVAERTGDRFRQAHTHQGLGQLHFAENRLDESERHLHQAFDLASQTADRLCQATVSLAIAGLEQKRGRLDAARSAYSDSLEKFAVIGETRGSAYSLSGLGYIQLLQHSLPEAKRSLARSVDLAKQVNDAQIAAHGHHCLSLLNMELGDYESAEDHLGTAETFYRRSASREGLMYFHTHSGLLSARMDRLPRALTHMRTALALADSVGNVPFQAALARFQADLVADPVVRLGWLVRGVGAVEGLRAVQVSGVEADFWQERFAGLYVECLRAAVDAADAGVGLWVMEAVRARRVAGLLAASRDGRVLPDQAAAVMAEIDQIRAELAALQPPPSDPDGTGGPSWRSLPLSVLPDLDIDPEVRVARLAELHSELDVLHGRLAEATSEGFAELWDPTVLDIDQLVAVARDGTDVIAFHVEGTEVWTVWVDPERTPAAIHHLDLDEHPRLAAQLALFAAHDPASWDGHDPDPQHLAPLRDLFPDTLLDLWRHQTPGAPPRRLLLIPSGPLWAVPFAAIPIDPDRLLIDVTDLAATPTLRIGHHTPTVDQHLLPTDARILGCAHPDFTRDLDQPAELFANFHPVDTDLAGQLHHQSWDVATLPAHGNHQPGLAHTLDFHTTRLTAADLLGRPTPTTLHLAACAAGYTPGHHPTEPYGIPTIALTHGTHTIYTATTLLQNHPTTHHILDHLWQLATTEEGPPERHLAHLQRTRPPHTPLLAWAPLTTHTTR